MRAEAVGVRIDTGRWYLPGSVRPVTRMLLARHAQSEWNAQGRWQGRADPPLSSLGATQAARASDRLGHVDVIVASPLQRALATAEIIAERTGVGPVQVDPDLAERDVGEWSGLTRDEIERGWPGYLEDRRQPEGFESSSLVLARLTAALERIEAAHRGADVLVITHGGLIYVLEEHHDEPFQRIPNLGARSLRHRGGHVELGSRLALLDEPVETVPAGM